MQSPLPFLRAILFPAGLNINSSLAGRGSSRFLAPGGQKVPVIGTMAAVIGTMAAVIGTMAAVIGTMAAVIGTMAAIIGTMAAIIAYSSQ